MQISNAPTPGKLGGQRRQHGSDDGLLALRTRLQEGAGGWRDRNATQRDTHGSKLGGNFRHAIAPRPGDARQAMGSGKPRQQHPPSGIQHAIGAQQQIRPGIEQVQHRRAITLQRRQARQQIA